MKLFKECRSCKTLLPIIEFPNHKGKPDGRGTQCKKCNTTLRYSLSRLEFMGMCHDQNYQCAICKCTLDMGKRTHIDHKHTKNHKRGRRVPRENVRGILCHDCNFLLGCCKDDTDILDRAIKYLRSYDTDHTYPP